MSSSLSSVSVINLWGKSAEKWDSTLKGDTHPFHSHIIFRFTIKLQVPRSRVRRLCILFLPEVIPLFNSFSTRSVDNAWSVSWFRVFYLLISVFSFWVNISEFSIFLLLFQILFKALFSLWSFVFMVLTVVSLSHFLTFTLLLCVICVHSVAFKFQVFFV